MNCMQPVFSKPSPNILGCRWVKPLGSLLKKQQMAIAESMSGWWFVPENVKTELRNQAHLRSWYNSLSTDGASAFCW